MILLSVLYCVKEEKEIPTTHYHKTNKNSAGLIVNYSLSIQLQQQDKPTFFANIYIEIFP